MHKMLTNTFPLFGCNCNQYIITGSNPTLTQNVKILPCHLVIPYSLHIFVETFTFHGRQNMKLFLEKISKFYQI